MSVDSNAGIIDAPQAAAIDISTDDALGAIWDKHERDNGAERGEDGRFSSPNKVEEQASDGGEPLEGGEGGDIAAEEGSTAPVTVPLPSNMRGLEEVWAKIPPDLQKPIAEQQGKLHKTLSEQGQALATWKPVRDTIEEFKDYFGGTRGNHDPAEAIRELFSIQRAMDDNPLQTVLEISKRYDLIPQLAQVFGAQGEGGTASPAGRENAALLAEIGELKNTINDLKSGIKPEVFDERLNQKLLERDELNEARNAISRTLKDMPLLNDVPQDDMVHYIQRAWGKLGETASKDDVLKRAYDMAVHADPDLRARAAALKGAATSDAAKVAAAKRANDTNLKSTSTGKARELTEEELLGSIFDKHAKG